MPNASRVGHVSVMLPASNGSSWLTVYREMSKNTLGVFLSSSRGTAYVFSPGI